MGLVELARPRRSWGFLCLHIPLRSYASKCMQLSSTLRTCVKLRPFRKPIACSERMRTMETWLLKRVLSGVLESGFLYGATSQT
jgi:hypothetical protein